VIGVIEQKIDEFTAELAGDDPPHEGYLAKVARLTAARQHAQEPVLGEYLPHPPAPAAPAARRGAMNLALASTVLFPVALFGGVAVGWSGGTRRACDPRRHLSLTLDPIVNAILITRVAVLTLARMWPRKDGK
jgi:hypothetical protein